MNMYQLILYRLDLLLTLTKNVAAVKIERFRRKHILIYHFLFKWTNME